MDVDLQQQIKSLVSARNKLYGDLKQINLKSKGIYVTKGSGRINRDNLAVGKGYYNRQDHGKRGYNHAKYQENEANSIIVEVNDIDGPNQSTLDNGIDTDETPRPKLDTNFSQGQKRIMAVGILGYLKKAKNQLDLEGTSEKSKKQKEVENAVEDKIRIEKERIEMEVAKELQEKRCQALDKLDQVQKELEEKENLLLKMKLIEHHTELSKYIQTKTNPPILWLPNKMNNVTSTLLDNSKQLQQGKIEQIEIRFSQPEDVEMEI